MKKPSKNGKENFYMNEEIENKIFILDEKELFYKIQELIQNEDVSLIEAIICISEELDIEPEIMAKVVGHGILKDKIQAEAESKNMILKSTTAFKLL